MHYVGCDLNEAALTHLIKGIAEDIFIEIPIHSSIEGIDVVKKEKDGKVFMVLTNHYNQPTFVNIPGEFNNILTGEKVSDKVYLDAYGVVILV